MSGESGHAIGKVEVQIEEEWKGWCLVLERKVTESGVEVQIYIERESESAMESCINEDNGEERGDMQG